MGPTTTEHGRDETPGTALASERAVATEVPDAETATRSLVRQLPTAARMLIAFLFFVFGLNGLLRSLPPPTSALRPEMRARR